MNDERLKIVLTLLGGALLALIFILIALVAPVQKSQNADFQNAPAKSKLEQISKELRER